ncbi:MAG: hypothetical protein ILO53_00595 [Clostridia bacterium]|nr:hypothetical protein [Clostridia bacterium]
MNSNNHSNMPVCGIDSLGRRTPGPGPRPTGKESCKDDRKKTGNETRLVGLFYFLWLCEGNKRVYDVSKITAADPDAGCKPDDPMWGKVGDYHYWGEPFYGYYSMSDEWVVRRHMKLIMEADIDFLFFDTTNAVVYEPVCHTVMKVLSEYAAEGFKIPQVMFYTNTHSGATAERIYREFYKPGLYRDTWFCLDGKPVIIAIPEECPQEVKDFFNVKLSQWPNEPTKQGGWPWMDFEKPQRVFEDLQGNPETINVSVAQHPQIRFGDSVLYGETTNCGRAWHNGDNDRSPNAYVFGYNFEEQANRALETAPPVVLVTGWNEWIAGRWQGIPERPIMFVDCANYEYSRDIEMMRDGYFDNYFMQLISFVRKYKGTEDVPAALPGETVRYKGFRDGGFTRHCCGWTPEIVFSNDTMRCSIENVSLSRKDGSLSFEITADRIPPQEGAFFNVFVSLGQNAGYDFIVNYKASGSKGQVCRVNRPLPDNSGRSLERLCDDLTDVTVIGESGLSIRDNTVTVTVPEALLGLSGGSEIWFKVCDSAVPYERIDDFYDKGDVLPMGRPGFVYRLG